MLAKDEHKIARAKNNGHELSVMAKKVGSNYFLKNKRLEFLPIAPFNLLAAPAPAASQSAVSLQMCRERESNPHVLTDTRF